MEVIIREAEPKDAPVIVQLIAALAASSGENSPLTESYVLQYLSTSAGTILLAESQGSIVGLLTYSLRPDLYHAAKSCLIEELVIRDDKRGQGVGSALIAELYSRLSSQDCAEVSLAVMPDNTGAIRFYKRHGLTDEAIFLEKHFPR